jgi:hypothetical protein
MFSATLRGLIGLGLSVSVGGCAVSVGRSPDVFFVKPYGCQPYGDSQGRLDEYRNMIDENRYPESREWIKYADRSCRANNTLLGQEDQEIQ